MLSRMWGKTHTMLSENRTEKEEILMPTGLFAKKIDKQVFVWYNSGVKSDRRKEVLP